MNEASSISCHYLALFSKTIVFRRKVIVVLLFVQSVFWFFIAFLFQKCRNLCCHSCNLVMMTVVKTRHKSVFQCIGSYQISWIHEYKVKTGGKGRHQGPKSFFSGFWLFFLYNVSNRLLDLK